MKSACHIRCGNNRIACIAAAGQAPTVVFLGGFRSQMRGTKAQAVAQHCARQHRAVVRFDYSGHGDSDGAFEDATIGDWLAQALCVIDELTNGDLLLVGSSMGAWIALLAACRRPHRIAGIVTVAAAPDMTERLIRPGLSAAQCETLQRAGAVRIESAYDPAGYLITQRLLDEGRSHQLLDRALAIDVPIRLLHGDADTDVPWALSREIMQRVASGNVRLDLVKDADHRFSAPAQLELLLQRIDELSSLISG